MLRLRFFSFIALLILLTTSQSGCGGGGGGGGSSSGPPRSGSLDTSFGTGGIVKTGITANQDDDANAVAVQSDGKILAAGDTLNGNGDYDFALTRYKPDGSLDTGFGNGGIVTTDVTTTGKDDFAYAVAIQSDGKIIAAGPASNGADNDFALVRYNTDGSPDAGFGTNGIVTTDVTMTGKDDFAYAVAIQSDGKILAAGSAFNGADNDFALVRYNTDGSPDAGFGTNGIVTTDVPTGRDDSAFAVGIQADGKIVVAGPTANVSLFDFALVRYNSDGTLDTSFGAGGVVTTDVTIGEGDFALALSIQPDGKIVVGGPTFNGANDDFALVRYNANGSLDTSFGSGGIVKTDVTAGQNDDAYALAIQSDGKIVAGGYSNNLNTNMANFALVRYNPDGSQDTSFGAGGIVTTDVASGDDDYAVAVAIQSDGRIVAAGDIFNGSDYDMALVRYRP